MLKKCGIFLMVLHCVLAKSIAVDEKAEVPIERSSVHFSYGLSPVQMIAVHQIPNNKMTGHVVLHTSQPFHFYHAVPTSPHIAYVNAIPNPAYVSVLNNPKIKSGYSFMFSSPHLVKFHDNQDQYEAKIEFMNTHVHVESLQGNFEDFIKKEEQFGPNVYVHTDEAKPLINTVESVAIDITEATTLATTRETTMITPIITQENEDKMEGVKTDLLNVETLHGKLEDFIQKDPPPFVNGQPEEIIPSVHPIENVNSDITEATTLATTRETTMITPIVTKENEDKMESVKTDLLNVETLHGKLEDFIQKDPPSFVNGHPEETIPSVHPIENVNSDVTEATTLVATRATTMMAPSSSQENRLGEVEYDIDIRKDDE